VARHGLRGIFALWGMSGMPSEPMVWCADVQGSGNRAHIESVEVKTEEAGEVEPAPGAAEGGAAVDSVWRVATPAGSTGMMIRKSPSMSDRGPNSVDDGSFYVAVEETSSTLPDGKSEQWIKIGEGQFLPKKFLVKSSAAQKAVREAKLGGPSVMRFIVGDDGFATGYSSSSEQGENDDD
jgi:hypothetical protein